jgi:hypothetical protein
MQFLRPEVLGDYFDFLTEWCTATGTGKWRIKEPKALGTYLRETYAMIRRDRKDVGQEMDQVNPIVENVDYDEKEVRSVEDLAHKLAIKASTGAFVERGQAARELDIMVRQSTGIAKAKAVAQFTRMLVESGESVVLVGWHRSVYDIWLRELADLNPAMYTGSESGSQKHKSAKAFINGETKLLIGSLRSGAGLDGLQFASSVIVFGELDWSPMVHKQWIWRLDREGQTDPVMAFFLVTDEGSDPPMMDVLGLKNSEARAIMDPHLDVEVNENDPTHLQKLVERYLNKRRHSTAELIESEAHS